MVSRSQISAVTLADVIITENKTDDVTNKAAENNRVNRM